MKPYPSYKDSGVRWIGEIPSEWDSVKLKYIGFLYGGLSGKSGKDFNNDENTNNKPFIPFTNICDNTYISKDNLGMVCIIEDDSQNRVEKNDLFFLMSSEDQEGIGKPSVLKEELGEVYLNTFCRGFRITDKKYDSLFVNYLLSGHSYRELLSVEGRGFTRINLRLHKVSDFQIHYPPKETQTQIVSFLDTKTQKIDELIERTDQKIELLKEKRTSLINHCVTKGLNPNVEMKDSGVEWIGDIPSHWGVKKLKYISDVFSSSVDRHIYEDEIQVFICHYPDVYNNEFINDEIELNKGSCSEVEFQRYILKKGLVILTKDSETPDDIGNPCYIENDFDNVVCGYHLTIIEKNKDDIDSEFLFRFIQSDKVRCHFETESRGITRFSLGKSKIENLFVNLPSYSEQTQIIAYLDEQTQKIDSTIEKETQRIELLKEYRQSLISEVVTGKVDVREWKE